jgi:hypothetical protein
MSLLFWRLAILWATGLCMVVPRGSRLRGELSVFRFAVRAEMQFFTVNHDTFPAARSSENAALFFGRWQSWDKVHIPNPHNPGSSLARSLQPQVYQLAQRVERLSAPITIHTDGADWDVSFRQIKSHGPLWGPQCKFDKAQGYQDSTGRVSHFHRERPETIRGNTGARVAKQKV